MATLHLVDDPVPPAPLPPDGPLSDPARELLKHLQTPLHGKPRGWLTFHELARELKRNPDQVQTAAEELLRHRLAQVQGNSVKWLPEV